MYLHEPTNTVALLHIVYIFIDCNNNINCTECTNKFYLMYIEYTNSQKDLYLQIFFYEAHF